MPSGSHPTAPGFVPTVLLAVSITNTALPGPQVDLESRLVTYNFFLSGVSAAANGTDPAGNAIVATTWLVAVSMAEMPANAFVAYAIGSARASTAASVRMEIAASTRFHPGMRLAVSEKSSASLARFTIRSRPVGH